MDSFNKLSKIFSDFPGIGPRQSKRFVYFLLSRNKEYIEEFALLLGKLKHEIRLCQSCFRYFPAHESSSSLCSLCANQNRDKSKLMLVARDIDLENMERSGAYDGYYFVLGGTVPILEKEPEKRVRIGELLKRLEKETALKEIIIAMNANPEGENTEDYIREKMKGAVKNVQISTLGRGLSTGVELEYSDPDTLKNALKNRHT